MSALVRSYWTNPRISDRFIAEGFRTAEQKSIKYCDIKEVHLHQGIVQRKHDLGTLHLSTASAPAMSGSNRAFSGIRQHNILDMEEVYQKAKELVGQEEQTRYLSKILIIMEGHCP